MPSTPEPAGTLPAAGAASALNVMVLPFTFSVVPSVMAVVLSAELPFRGENSFEVAERAAVEAPRVVVAGAPLMPRSVSEVPTELVIVRSALVPVLSWILPAPVTVEAFVVLPEMVSIVASKLVRVWSIPMV